LIRAGQPLTTNRFIEALAARWSERYRQTREARDTGRLANFKPETVVAIRDELVGQGVAYQKLWTAIRNGVPGLYVTSAPIKHRGRTITVGDDDDQPLPLLAPFDQCLAADPSYQREAAGATRLLLAADPMPPRRIAQRVAGEQPYDIMRIGPGTERALQRLERSRVFLRVAEVLKDMEVVRAKLVASEWPAIRRAWHTVLPELYLQAGLDVPARAPTRASGEMGYWNRVERELFWKARKAFRAEQWRAYLAVGDHQTERDRHNSLKGRLTSMTAIHDQLSARGIADDATVELKSSFYKHRTRRFQAVNVWPPEVSAGEETVLAIPPDAGAMLIQAAAELHGDEYAKSIGVPRALVQPQRTRWFPVRTFAACPEGVASVAWVPRSKLQALTGLDVSGSQAQILAVLMGLRDVEKELRELPFKTLVALSARALHQRGELRLPNALLEDAGLLEANAKSGMKLLYGASERNLARDLQRDPERYGPGLDAETLRTLFKKTPVIAQLRQFLTACEAVARAACAKSPSDGVWVVDPFDGVSFTWNPPKRRKQQVRSGAFKLYCYPPVVIGDGTFAGEYKVDEGKLTRRIAPGLIQMADSLFAAWVGAALEEFGVHDVVAIHDAFLVPASSRRALVAAFDVASQLWLPRLGPIYDVFERYLPDEHEHGETVRQWRATWEQRLADCRAGRDAWPSFRTKDEGARVV
jgi:hypothetical protein